MTKQNLLNVNNTEFDTIYIGDYISSGKGYNYIDLKGTSKSWQYIC